MANLHPTHIKLTPYFFSNTFSIADDEIIEKYLESKREICKKLVERGLAHEKNR